MTRETSAETPVFIIGEIGINHNGDLGDAFKLIESAAEAGVDAVKFQKRDPAVCVPEDQKSKMRETPWGYISYLDYRYRVEFDEKQYLAIAGHCAKNSIQWSASCWDMPSLEFMDQFDLAFHKIPSAMITNLDVVAGVAERGIRTFLSTGMSTMAEIDACVSVLREAGTEYELMHTTSTYPCPLEELNLQMIPSLARRFGVPVGYSGHETGLATTVAAVALGARSIERHITLDRSMWGSDQAASVEPGGLKRLVRDIRDVERALGDGVKRVYDSELPVRAKLRTV